MIAGLANFAFTYQYNPIMLTGNSVVTKGRIPAQMSLMSLTQSGFFGDPASPNSSTSYFAHFEPIAGGSLIDQEIASYPFANQAIAANAVISQPLAISMKMICPAQTTNGNGYSDKLATITALVQTLRAHNASGGTYSVCTPAYYFLDCVMRGMRDVTGGETKQVQAAWQFDFVQPLLTLDAAQGAQSNLISKMTAGIQVPAVNGAIANTSPSNATGVPSSGAPPTAGTPGVTN